MSKILTSIALAGLCSVVASAAQAGPVSSLSAQYFVLSPSNPDVNTGIDGSRVTGLVANTLGVDGLPVYTGKIAPSSGKITDVNAANEILWWTPGGTVTSAPAIGPATVSLPYDQHLFPNGSNNGADGYVSAHLSGSFSIPSPGSITLNFGSDDDGWVFIDNQLVIDNGGIHADAVAPTSVTSLSAGTHDIEVFFADRHTVQSELSISADVNFTPVPEPASMALVGAGLLGLGMVRRKRA